MLEPRWRKEWLKRPNVTFLGGTAKFDLWHASGGNVVRFVSGESLGGWDQCAVGRLPILKAAGSVLGPQEEVDMALDYLRLFAPDLFRESPNQ